MELSRESVRKHAVLLVRHDNDCGYSHRRRAYAHLLDSLGDLLQSRGVRVCVVAAPYSRLTGERAHNSPVSVNEAVRAIDLFGHVVRRLAGARRADALVQRLTTSLWRRLMRRADARYVVAIEPSRAIWVNVVPLVERSTRKLLSLVDLSAHARSMRLIETGVAIRFSGTRGSGIRSYKT